MLVTTLPSITENLWYDDLSGVRTTSCVLSVGYMSRYRRRPAVRGVARTLREIATTVRDMVTSGG